MSFKKGNLRSFNNRRMERSVLGWREKGFFILVRERVATEWINANKRTPS